MRVVIVGGGPAGSSLAIRCAAAGLAAVVVERETFPREKLCGEFISPECTQHFEELGVAEALAAAGAQRLTETRFFSISGREAAIPCKWFGGDALGLSRARMDKVLLDRAREAGAEVIEGAQAVKVGSKAGRVTHIEVNRAGVQEQIEGDIFVDATGRAGVLAKLLARGAGTRETRNGPAAYLGFKTHLRGTALPPGRCEMYLFRGGYAGLSHVEDGRANLCFLIDTETARLHGASGERLMREVITTNPRGREVLANAQADDKWLTVAVERFGRGRSPG
jgi:menaquinone-9 beta-reductase